MSDVTRILSDIEHGDPAAAEQLLPLVYDELRKLAAAKLAQFWTACRPATVVSAIPRSRYPVRRTTSAIATVGRACR